MDDRYLQIAADLRRRISDGTWPVGTRLPTLRQLQDDYSDVGSFVSSVPPATEDDVSDAVEQLHLVRSAATRALKTLESRVIRPVRAEIKRPENPATEVWGPMQSAFCRDCSEELGGVTRGWVATEDYYGSDISYDGHDELEHDVVVTYGAAK